MKSLKPTPILLILSHLRVSVRLRFTFKKYQFYLLKITLQSGKTYIVEKMVCVKFYCSIIYIYIYNHFSII